VLRPPSSCVFEGRRGGWWRWRRRQQCWRPAEEHNGGGVGGSSWKARTQCGCITLWRVCGMHRHTNGFGEFRTPVTRLWHAQAHKWLKKTQKSCDVIVACTGTQMALVSSGLLLGNFYLLWRKSRTAAAGTKVAFFSLLSSWCDMRQQILMYEWQQLGWCVHAKQAFSSNKCVATKSVLSSFRGCRRGETFTSKPLSQITFIFYW